MKPTVVTGSYIPTAETVGPSPVDIIGRQEIEKVGTQDVLQTLRTFSPSFSGNANIGQALNNGGYGEAYVAIRNLPTLVLIDGKRLPISPFSTFVQTFSPDVNMIPVSFIDHIEVLKDGASAIYGSDAIGGVVNIITKKRPEAGREQLFSPWWADFDAHYGFGMNHGTYNEYRVSGDIGYNQDCNRLVVGGQYYHNDPIFAKDRHIASLSAQELQAAGLLAPSYFSPSYPGRVGSFLLAGSPLAQGAPGFNPTLTTPPVFAGQSFSTVQAYNAYAIAHGYVDPTGNGLGPYIPISSTPASQALGGAPGILNTALLNPISLQKQDRKSVFANGEHDFFDDHLTAYGQLLYTETVSKGQLAPAPIPALSLYNLTLPADNPFNAFGEDIGLGGTGPAARSRLIETGPRLFETISSLWHFLAGFKGNLLDNKVGYDINAAYGQTTSEQRQNSASSILLNEAMTPSAGNPAISVLGVPTYNILALPGFNDPATINAIRASDAQTGFSDLFELQGVFTWNVFDLPGGTFTIGPGAQFVHEKLVTGAGALLASGNLIGLNALPPFPGGIREREAGWIEAHLPVTGPDMHIPAFYSFEIYAAGRVEYIDSHFISGGGNNFGNTAVPKVGLRWQPIDEQLTLRGTYSQGFVVPQLTQLFGPPLNSNPYVVTPTASDDPTLVAAQENVFYLANPDLPPSKAETWTAGVVYSPKWAKNLTVSVDWYHVEQTSYNFIPSASAMVADLNARGAASVWNNNPALHGTPVYLDQNNNPFLPTPGDPTTFINANDFGTLNIPTLPGGSIRTEGLDLSLNYKWDLNDWGVLNLFGNANYLFDYQVKLGAGQPWLNYKGEYTDSQAVAAPQGMIPQYNLSVGFTYSLCNFDYTVIAHYLPSVIDLGDMHPSVGSPVNDFTANGRPWHVNDYYRLDMQLAYNFISKDHNKWWDNTRIAVGCNNITDQKPNLIASSSEDNTDKGSYDIIGRFLYFELSKRF
jgi:iron complex outermembrane receptor protein